MIHLILVLIVIGFAMWLVSLIPMPNPYRSILMGVIAIVVLIWLLQAVGVLTGFPRVRL